MELLGLALAPVIFLFTLVYLWDRHEREPIPRLILTFFFGILTAIPAIFGEIYLEQLTGFHTGPALVPTLLYALIVVAFVEEFVKYFVVRVYSYPSKQFNEPYDGIMYAVAVSLGFAAIENVGYVFMDGGGIEVAWARMFTAVPMHAMCGVIMGYYVGHAKFKSTPSGAFWDRMKGLFAAVTIHGLYDFFLMWEVEAVAILAIVVLIVAIILGIRAMRIHSRKSPHNPGNRKP